MKPLLALAFAGVFSLAGCADAKPTRPTPQETYVAGDSLCVGLAQASGLKSVARVGAPTREVVSQLKRIPEGATVVLCVGTNDMPSRLVGFAAAVDAVVAEAERRNQRLIWVGPINTPLWWDRYSAEADKHLSSKIKDYITLRRQWITGEHDGVFHLTSKGYARLWAIVKEKI
jgi:hypothetical protein